MRMWNFMYAWQREVKLVIEERSRYVTLTNETSNGAKKYGSLEERNKGVRLEVLSYSWKTIINLNITNFGCFNIKKLMVSNALLHGYYLDMHLNHSNYNFIILRG